MKIKIVIFLIGIYILFMMFSLFGISCAKKKFNVLLISVDTLRRDVLGCYGSKDRVTPNIDELANQGVLFENAISVSPWTIPAHFSMFTGLYPAKHRMNIAYPPEIIFKKIKPLASGIKTIGEIFKEKGYLCAAFTGGKYLKGNLGYERGFDLYDNDCADIKNGVEKLINWLKIHKQETFFVFLHTYSMHFPYRAYKYSRKFNVNDYYNVFVEKYYKFGDGDIYRRGSLKITKEEINNIYSSYKDCAVYVDMQIGYLMAYLKNNGLLTNTIILFTSDHGEEFYEHDAFLHGHTLFQEQLNIPLIMYLPKISNEKHKCHELVSNIDIFPTLYEILDGKKYSDGISLFEILKGKERRNFVFSEATHGVELKSLTTKKYKLILNTKPGKYEYAWKENDLKWQVYNLLDDPKEKYNMADLIIPEFRNLKEVLTAILEKNTSYHPPATTKAMERIKFEDREIEELKSLGYMQ